MAVRFGEIPVNENEFAELKSEDNTSKISTFELLPKKVRVELINPVGPVGVVFAKAEQIPVKFVLQKVKLKTLAFRTAEHPELKPTYIIDVVVP